MTSNMTSNSHLTMPSDHEVAMSRVFDAPRALVYQAVTDPKMIAEWWGLRSTKTIIDKYDFRVGGEWRFVQRDADGNEYAFRGEIREIVPLERVVQTFEFEGMPGHIVVDAMTLEDTGDGKTRLTTVSTFTSQEDRDGMMASGMEQGANESWDLLGELLARLQA